MTENPNTESTSSQTENSAPMIPKSRFDDVNNKYKDAMTRLEQLEQTSQQQQAEAEAKRQQDLAEQNRYKELYEDLKAKYDGMQSVQSEVKRYKESFESRLQADLERIPEDKRHLVPDFGDPIKLSEWLSKALPDLSAPSQPIAPKLDGGSGGSVGQRNTSNLTQAEVDFANAAGIPLDAYAASKAQRGQPVTLDNRQKQE